MIPNPTNPQHWNRYSYVSNNPLNYADPSGHMQVDDGNNDRGSNCHGIFAKYCLNGKPLSRKLLELMNDEPADHPSTCDTANPSILCRSVPEETIATPLFTPLIGSQHQSTDHGYSNPDFDALYTYWNNIVMPFNDILSAEDMYNLSSKGGWRASRSALSLGLIEAFVQGGRQAYRDSWYQTLTPTQRGLRPIVAGLEAFATDAVSGLVGNGYAVAGFMVGGPPGAAAGQLAGATYATHTLDRFWMRVNSNYLNFLGAWP